MMKKVRLQWLVDGDTEWGHLSTIDVMYVDAETGELIGEILPYGLGDWGRRIFDRKERNIPCDRKYLDKVLESALNDPDMNVIPYEVTSDMLFEGIRKIENF